MQITSDIKLEIEPFKPKTIKKFKELQIGDIVTTAFDQIEKLITSINHIDRRYSYLANGYEGVTTGGTHEPYELKGQIDPITFVRKNLAPKIRDLPVGTAFILNEKQPKDIYVKCTNEKIIWLNSWAVQVDSGLDLVPYKILGELKTSDINR